MRYYLVWCLALRLAAFSSGWWSGPAKNGARQCTKCRKFLKKGRVHWLQCPRCGVPKYKAMLWEEICVVSGSVASVLPDRSRCVDYYVKAYWAISALFFVGWGFFVRWMHG